MQCLPIFIINLWWTNITTYKNYFISKIIRTYLQPIAFKYKSIVKTYFKSLHKGYITDDGEAMGSPGSTSSEFSSPGGGVAGIGSPGGATTTTGM